MKKYQMDTTAAPPMRPQAPEAGACCEHPPAHESPLACTTRQLEQAAAMCHAMSDPARMRLLLWLQRGERCVAELTALEQGKTGSISARLQTLHAARLVSRRREARHVYYALADDHVTALIENVLRHAGEAEDRLQP